jgi:hypothetical protein
MPKAIQRGRVKRDGQPYLAIKSYKDRKPEQQFVIRDGQRTIGTGCGVDDRESAQKKLRAYVIKKHDPAKALDKDNQVKIADVLALGTHREADPARRGGLIG